MIFFSRPAAGRVKIDESTHGRNDAVVFYRASEGFIPLSWNGLAFDFDVLAEQSGLVDDCRENFPVSRALTSQRCGLKANTTS